jgi:hypothetical protein
VAYKLCGTPTGVRHDLIVCIQPCRTDWGRGCLSGCHARRDEVALLLSCSRSLPLSPANVCLAVNRESSLDMTCVPNVCSSTGASLCLAQLFVQRNLQQLHCKGISSRKLERKGNTTSFTAVVSLNPCLKSNQADTVQHILFQRILCQPLNERILTGQCDACQKQSL